MKTILACVMLGLLTAACGAETSTADEKTEERPATDEEHTGTVSEEMKWNPSYGVWLPCLVNFRMCQCRGNVEDCR